MQSKDVRDQVLLISVPHISNLESRSETRSTICECLMIPTDDKQSHFQRKNYDEDYIKSILPRLNPDHEVHVPYNISIED
jgi:hypothetical protein